MKKHTLHKHHIIPKHAGGTDDPSNLVELTVEEHAEAHRKLYEEYGRIQDKLAYEGLKGLKSCQEIVYTLHSERMKGKNNPMYGKPAPNRGIKRPGVGGRKKGTTWSDNERKLQTELRNTDQHLKKMNESVWNNEERNRKIGEAHKGKKGAATGKRWYNNGTEEKYFADAPEGWNPGRLSRKR